MLAFIGKSDFGSFTFGGRASVSWIIFAIALVYIIIAALYSAHASDKRQSKYEVYDRALHRAQYYQRMPKNPGLAKEVCIYESRADILTQWREAYKTIEDFDKKRKLSWATEPFISGFVLLRQAGDIALFDFCGCKG